MTDRMANRFRIIYLVERQLGSNKLLKMMGGRVLSRSKKTRPGHVRIGFRDHDVEIPEDALLKLAVLGHELEKDIPLNKSSLILEFVSSGLTNREIFHLFNECGIDVKPSLISAVKFHQRTALRHPRSAEEAQHLYG